MNQNGKGKLNDNQQAVADFLSGVKRAEEIHTYICISEDFAGKPIEYKALRPGDLLVLEESALSIKLTEMGYRTRGLQGEDFVDAVASVPKMDGIDVAVDGARAIVVRAAVKPLFSHLAPERCSSERVSIEDLPIEDTLLFSQEIKRVSGVTEAEDRFRRTDDEGEVATDAGEPERSENDSDTESETASA